MRRLTIFFIVFIVMGGWISSIQAQLLRPLPLNDAFVLSATTAPDNVVLLHWHIADKHYLYRERFDFTILQPKTARLGQILWPTGTLKSDAFYKNYQVYYNDVVIPVPIVQADPLNTVLQASFQGCSDDGYCYPPSAWVLNINFAANQITLNQPAPPPATAVVSSTDPINPLFHHGNFLWLLLSFFAIGLLLAFTPCVLPMIPILSAIIVGQRQSLTVKRGFALSLAYVLGMALAYALIGLLVGWAGGSLQAILQKPWIITLLSLFFIALALSLFDLYRLEIPKSWQAKLADASNRQQKGSYIGVFIMGLIASLIVSPCVTPALAGTLIYIGRTGNALLGATALATMGLGMGLPLLIVGALGGQWLPKAGRWMEAIKKIIGFLMLGVAIDLFARVMPGYVTLILWALLLIVAAAFLGLFNTAISSSQKISKSLSVILLIYSIILLVGAAIGNSNPLQPLRGLSFLQQDNAKPRELVFQPIKNIGDLNAALTAGQSKQQYTLVDFYADWCISCKEMDVGTFRDAAIQKQLANFQLLRADVTRNDAEDQALEHYLGVIAPPTLVFFNPQGQKTMTIVGEINSANLLQKLLEVQGSFTTSASP